MGYMGILLYYYPKPYSIYLRGIITLKPKPNRGRIGLGFREEVTSNIPQHDSGSDLTPETTLNRVRGPETTTQFISPPEFSMLLSSWEGFGFGGIRSYMSYCLNSSKGVI